jgi:protein dpy-30
MTSTRTYLQENVVSVVQEGMLELVRKRPDNPLEFLGNFILERAKNK